MKRRLLILIICIVTLLAIGCTKAPTYEHSDEIMNIEVEATDNIAPDTTVQQDSPVATKEIRPPSKTVDVFFVSSSHDGKPGHWMGIDEMLEALNEKLLEDLNINVNFNWFSTEEYSDEISLLFASDDAPDMIQVDEGSADVRIWSSEGHIANIYEFAHSYMPKTMATIGNFPDYISTQAADEALYVLSGIQYNPVRYIVSVTKEISDEYQKDINTLDDYDDFLEWVAKTNPDLTPGIIDLNTVIDASIKGAGYKDDVSTFYKRIENNHLISKPIEEIPEFHKAYEMLQRWDEEEHYFSIFDEVGYAWYNAMREGRLASTIAPYEYMRASAVFARDNYRFVNHVLYKDTGMIRSKNTTGFAFCENGDAMIEAMQFLEWTHESQDNYDLIQYGVQDRHYALIDNMLNYSIEIYLHNIYDWEGSMCFKDITLDRQIINDAVDDYYAYIQSVSIDNTITREQYYENAGIDINAVNKKLQEDTSFLDDINNNINMKLEVRGKEYSGLVTMWELDDFSLTVDEVAQKLSEASGEELETLINERNEMMYYE
ncbi:MAG: extracellular solute-binding protein [Clostridiales bacterium]|nr:extracellular solute-binding protein [Clostridiales bacterium]